jgi:hypothetical protein
VKSFGTKGRRFESCLPDFEGRDSCRDSSRETDGSRPSPFPDGALRTTGAPKSVTSGADGADSTPPMPFRSLAETASSIALPSAVPAFLEACAKLGTEAARRGDHARASVLFALASRAAETESKV